jgi:hypothetical protein
MDAKQRRRVAAPGTQGGRIVTAWTDQACAEIARRVLSEENACAERQALARETLKRGDRGEALATARDVPQCTRCGRSGHLASQVPWPAGDKA